MAVVCCAGWLTIVCLVGLMSQPVPAKLLVRDIVKMETTDANHESQESTFKLTAGAAATVRKPVPKKKAPAVDSSDDTESLAESESDDWMDEGTSLSGALRDPSMG